MKVICWILNKLAPIINLLGIFGFIQAVLNDDWVELFIAIPFAVVGLLFGIKAYRLGIPPRWFWSKSANDIFDYTVTAVLGYTFMFAAMPLGWYLVANFIYKLN